MRSGVTTMRAYSEVNEDKMPGLWKKGEKTLTCLQVVAFRGGHLVTLSSAREKSHPNNVPSFTPSQVSVTSGQPRHFRSASP